LEIEMLNALILSAVVSTSPTELTCSVGKMNTEAGPVGVTVTLNLEEIGTLARMVILGNPEEMCAAIAKGFPQE
jgi:hypothetical protein